MPRTALITGVTGQDGALLARLLLEKGYTVHGMRRRSSSASTARIDQLLQDPGKADSFQLHYGDMTDANNLMQVIGATQPDEIYNLAAQSDVKVSFEAPEYTANTDALGALRLLEAVRALGMASKVRIYQASTSEMFGASPAPQSEGTPFKPQSPYAAAKLHAHWLAVNYRAAYGMHVSCGILFNHESPLRGPNFASRKITRAAAASAAGSQMPVTLGNLDARRDWGHARLFLEGIWRIVQHHEPDDFVLATGETHTVREFAELAFAAAGMTLAWQGEGLHETATDQSGVVRVKVDQQMLRPTEAHELQGDASKAKAVLGWAPKVTFAELVREMVEADIALLRQPR